MARAFSFSAQGKEIKMQWLINREENLNETKCTEIRENKCCWEGGKKVFHFPKLNYCVTLISI